MNIGSWLLVEDLQNIVYCILSDSEKQPFEDFFNISVLENFALFTGKDLCLGLFLIKLQAFRSAFFLKRDSNTGAFL